MKNMEEYETNTEKRKKCNSDRLTAEKIYPQ